MARFLFFLSGGISKFFQSPLNVYLAKVLHIRILRFYIFSLGFLYFLLKRTDLKFIMQGLSCFQNLNSGNHKFSVYPLCYKTLKGTCEHFAM